MFTPYGWHRQLDGPDHPEVPPVSQVQVRAFVPGTSVPGSTPTPWSLVQTTHHQVLSHLYQSVPACTTISRPDHQSIAPVSSAPHVQVLLHLRLNSTHVPDSLIYLGCEVQIRIGTEDSLPRQDWGTKLGLSNTKLICSLSRFSWKTCPFHFTNIWRLQWYKIFTIERCLNGRDKCKLQKQTRLWIQNMRGVSVLFEDSPNIRSQQ